MSDYRRSPRQAGLAVPALQSPSAFNGGASASSSVPQHHSSGSKAHDLHASYDGQHPPLHMPLPRVWRACVSVSSMHARRSLWKRLASDPRHLSACACDPHRHWRQGNSRGRRRTTQPLSVSTDNGSSGMVSLRHAHQLSNIGAGSSHVRSRSRRSNPTSDSTTPQQLTPRSTSDAGEQPYAPHSTPNSNSNQQRRGGKRRRSTEMNTPRDTNATAADESHAAAASNSGRGRASTRMDADSSASSSSQKRKSGGRRSAAAAPQLPDAASSAHFIQAPAAPAQPASQNSKGVAAVSVFASSGSSRGRSRKGRRSGGGGRGSNGNAAANSAMNEMRDRDPYPSTGSSAAGSPAASPTRQQPQLLESSYYSSSRDAVSASGASFHASLQQQANELVQAPPAASSGGGFSSRNRGRGKGGNSRGRRSQQQQRRSKAETDHENDPPIGAITPGRLPAARYGTPYNSNAFLLNNVSRSSPDVSDLLVPAAAQYGSMSGLPLSSASPAISAAHCSPSAPSAAGGVDDTMSDVDSVDEDSSHGLSSINEESDAAAAAAVDNSWRDELTDAARKLKGATSGAETWSAPDTASLLQSASTSSARRGGSRRGTRAGSRKKRRRTDKRGGGQQQQQQQQRNEAGATDTATAATSTAAAAQPYAASSQRAR